MIPPFDDNGNLAPGVHPATLEEVEDRFGKETELRRVQMQSLRWLVEIARRAGARRMLVNGSFVSDVAEPNDVDCVLLLDPDFPNDEVVKEELDEGLPFIQLYLAENEDYNYFIQRVYGTDRNNMPKGMLEVIL